MKRFAALACAAAVVWMATACTDSAKMHDDAVQAVKTLETQWNQDYAPKNVDKLASYYEDTAVLMAPGMPAASGTAAIRQELSQMAADPAMSLKFHSTKVDAAQSGELAYSQGTYEMTMTDPATKKPVSDHGTYVTVYHKQADGSWKAIEDIATSSVPPPAPASASKKGKAAKKPMKPMKKKH